MFSGYQVEKNFLKHYKLMLKCSVNRRHYLKSDDKPQYLRIDLRRTTRADIQNV